MQRFRAYDPPEYVGWTADPEVMLEYREQIEADPARRAIIESLSWESLLDLYRGLVRNRLHDIQLKRWVMQGVISKAWLGTGEEAATIGAVHALRRGEQGDVVSPMIRNAGACHEMGISLAVLFRTYLGTADTVLRGRDLHLGDLRHGVMAPVSVVGSLVPVCAGIALAFRQRGEQRVVLTWLGDGGVRTGEFHEGLGLAAAQRLPLIVVLQNNQVALGTRYETHSRVPLTEVARAYIEDAPLVCHGNNVLDVYAAASQAAARCREGAGPAILIAETGRMGGHATHDEAEARGVLPPEHFEYWGKRDPVGLYETYLAESPGEAGAGQAVAERLAAVEAEVTQEIESAVAAALRSREDAPPAPDTVADGVYAEPDGTEPGAGDGGAPAAPASRRAPGLGDRQPDGAEVVESTNALRTGRSV